MTASVVRDEGLGMRESIFRVTTAPTASMPRAAPPPPPHVSNPAHSVSQIEFEREEAAEYIQRWWRRIMRLQGPTGRKAQGGHEGHGGRSHSHHGSHRAFQRRSQVQVKPRR